MAGSVSPWPLVRQGDQQHPVQTLQYLLRARGHPVAVDGIFGPNTDGAVRAFQQQKNLSVDGVVGPNTWSALIVEVKQGSQGDAVRGVQEEFQFRNLSGDPGKGLQVDGIFGPKTDAAVRAFQMDKHLSVDGIVGPKTWSALIITVRRGSEGDAVRGVQEEFQFRAGEPGQGLQIDGIFGPQTEATVRGFQQALAADIPSVAVDGIVGPVTWQALISGMLAG
jgi:peptidoglycan hydrolase-like protein with peptidoglycan-binding domain